VTKEPLGHCAAGCAVVVGNAEVELVVDSMTLKRASGLVVVLAERTLVLVRVHVDVVVVMVVEVVAAMVVEVVVVLDVPQAGVFVVTGALNAD